MPITKRQVLLIELYKVLRVVKIIQTESRESRVVVEMGSCFMGVVSVLQNEKSYGMDGGNGCTTNIFNSTELYI